MTARTLEISSLGVWRVKMQVTVTQGGVVQDPSAGAVRMAFIPYSAADTEPAGGDWHTASWEHDTVKARWLATCLVGPGNVVLGDGRYRVWVEVTIAPQQGIMPSPETLHVT